MGSNILPEFCRSRVFTKYFYSLCEHKSGGRFSDSRAG